MAGRLEFGVIDSCFPCTYCRSPGLANLDTCRSKLKTLNAVLKVISHESLVLLQKTYKMILKKNRLKRICVNFVKKKKRRHKNYGITDVLTIT